MSLVCSDKISRLAVIALLFPAAAQADFYLHHWEDRYEPDHTISLAPELLYYTSNQNYGPDALKVVPPGFGDYKRIEGDLTGQFGLGDGWSIFARLSWARIEMDLAGASGTTYGLTDQSTGVTFRSFQSPLHREDWFPSSLDLQLQFDFPAYSRSGSPDTPELGDHTLDTTPGGFLTIPIWQDEGHALPLTGGAGYTFRSNHFSPQIPWTVRMNYIPKTAGFYGGAAAFGTISLRNDTTPLPTGLGTGSGGSLITGGVNSETIIFRVEAGYQFDPSSRLLVAYEQSLWGENAPAGQNATLGYRMSFLPTDEKAPYTKANRGLQEYSLDAKVLKANDRLNLVKIDKGSQDGVEKGQVFDIFTVSTEGNALEAVARAQVTSVKSDEAALTIVEYFKETWINVGFIAKRLVQ